MKQFRGIVCVFFFLSGNLAGQQSEIQIPYADFSYPGFGQSLAPQGWKNCLDNVPIVVDYHKLIQSRWGLNKDFPSASIEGKLPDTFLLIGAINMNIYTPVGLHLSDSLLSNVEYNLSFYSSSSYDYIFFPEYEELVDSLSGVQIWLGSDTCIREQLIFDSGPVGYQWKRHNFNFIPDAEYCCMGFIVSPTSYGMTINRLHLVDEFSSIKQVDEHDPCQHLDESDLWVNVYGQIHFNMDSCLPQRLEVRDLFGRLIHVVQNPSETFIDLTWLPAASYFIIATWPGGHRNVKKWIKAL